MITQPPGSVNVAWDGQDHSAARHVTQESMDLTAAWTVPATTTPLVTVSPAVASVDRAATDATVN